MIVSWVESMSSPHHSVTWPSAQIDVAENIRPPILFDASYTVLATPASCRVSAAFSPAIPAPTIAMRGLEGAAKAASGNAALAATAAAPATNWRRDGAACRSAHKSADRDAPGFAKIDVGRKRPEELHQRSAGHGVGPLLMAISAAARRRRNR